MMTERVQGNAGDSLLFRARPEKVNCPRTLCRTPPPCTILPHSPRNPAHSPQNPPHFVHTLHPRARLGSLPLPDGSRTFRARREGMPRWRRPDVGRGQRGGGGQRGSAGGRRSFGSAVQSQPPGRGPVPEVRVKRVGRDSGAGLWRTCLHLAGRVRAGTAPKAAPAARPGRGRGNPGDRALKRGRRESQPPRACKASACRVGTPSGEFRAARCQRHPIPTLPEALPARGPPDLPPVARSACTEAITYRRTNDFPTHPGGIAARAVSGCPDGGAASPRGRHGESSCLFARAAVNWSA